MVAPDAYKYVVGPLSGVSPGISPMFIIPEFTAEGGDVETYKGRIATLNDALLVLEATRVNVLPKIKRRLNALERKHIKANTVFAWNETECGMKRWTDGKNWLASKVSGPFLTYRELDDKKNVKPDGLIKQSFLLVTKQNQKLHLISYICSSASEAARTPLLDPKLGKLALNPRIYQENLLGSEADRRKDVYPQLPPASRNSSVDDSRRDISFKSAYDEPMSKRNRAYHPPLPPVTVLEQPHAADPINITPLLPALQLYKALACSTPLALIPVLPTMPMMACGGLMPPFGYPTKRQSYSCSDNHALSVLDRGFLC